MPFRSNGKPLTDFLHGSTEKTGRSAPHNRMGKYNTDIKDKYRFDLFDWLCSENGKKKIKLDE